MSPSPSPNAQTEQTTSREDMTYSTQTPNTHNPQSSHADKDKKKVHGEWWAVCMLPCLFLQCCRGGEIGPGWEKCCTCCGMWKPRD
ncbi:hypothetical protein M011DRAFT_134530 [Sporormia fimetaria CBS 119925]|uniref:Uncharacterized protein n=1 Tax=Sporormia fimetaria CBS 119925 TaxID=1340428 RepID=A0A6A6V6S7_9PLEO|nr:hypothetical protein M011DRAFT_134530 [Sporormia fimetaria CBS 119925]